MILKFDKRILHREYHGNIKAMQQAATFNPDIEIKAVRVIR